MISRKDVLRLYVPFPDISSRLARYRHMYICRDVCGNEYKLVKCQTLKPYMLVNNPIVHYWDENPDPTRNPFIHATRIDCDKEFFTLDIAYDDALKTNGARTDVSDDVMQEVECELICDGYDRHELSSADMLPLNPQLSRIATTTQDLSDNSTSELDL